MVKIDPDPINRGLSDTHSDAGYTRLPLKAAAITVSWLVMVAVVMLIVSPGVWRHVWAAIP